MGKMKRLLEDILVAYDNGSSVSEIAKHYSISEERVQTCIDDYYEEYEEEL